MRIAEQFAAELQQEAATTRRVLERVPEEQYTWKPHEKSMSLGQLALHLAQLPRAIADVVTPSETEIPNVPLPLPASRDELLATLDRSVAHAVEKFAAWGDDEMRAIWRMTKDGTTLLEIPRMAMIRAVMLNHSYHHRGQLTVYLRLLDVPLPSVYGPTADDNVFG